MYDKPRTGGDATASRSRYSRGECIDTDCASLMYHGRAGALPPAPESSRSEAECEIGQEMEQRAASGDRK